MLFKVKITIFAVQIKRHQLNMSKAPIIGISRLRMGTDGRGVTTLVAFHGCPLHCAYCLNPQCHEPTNKRITSEKLMKLLRKDELYFLASKGGVTFGGGEPYLHVGFIKEIMELGAKDWHTSVETSLNVPLDNLQELEPNIDEYIVDIKDMDGDTYKRYTLKDNNQVLDNLRWLIDNGHAQHIMCRIPLIPSYNSQEAQMKSRKVLSDMGITRFDFFRYKTNINKK